MDGWRDRQLDINKYIKTFFLNTILGNTIILYYFFGKHLKHWWGKRFMVIRNLLKGLAAF